MKTIMFIVIFLLIGAFFIISNEKIQMNSSENFQKFLGLYSNWLINIGVNGKYLAGYVIKMEWLPGGKPIQA